MSLGLGLHSFPPGWGENRRWLLSDDLGIAFAGPSTVSQEALDRDSVQLDLWSVDYLFHLTPF